MNAAAEATAAEAAVVDAVAEATAAEAAAVEAAEAAANEAAQTAEPNSSETTRAPKVGVHTPTGTAQRKGKEQHATWEDIAGPTDSIRWESITTANHASRDAVTKDTKRMPQ